MDMYTLLYLKWITDKALLYSMENSARCYVAAWMGREFEKILYAWLHLKWLTNKDLLYSTRNSARCYVAAWMGGEFRGELRQWHPTPALLPGKSHGQRSLVGCSPWGCKESDTTERLHFHFLLLCIGEGNGNPLQCSFLENPRDGVA